MDREKKGIMYVRVRFGRDNKEIRGGWSINGQGER